MPRDTATCGSRRRTGRQTGRRTHAPITSRSIAPVPPVINTRMILPLLGPFQCSFRRKQRRHQQQPGDLPTPREQGRPAGSPAPPHHVGVSASGSAPRSPAGKLVATSKHARIPLLIVTVACFKTGKVSCSLVRRRQGCGRVLVPSCARWCPRWCPNQRQPFLGSRKGQLHRLESTSEAVLVVEAT